jgi:hypothetical protein
MKLKEYTDVRSNETKQTQNVSNIVHSSTDEKETQMKLVEILKSSPIPDDELLSNLGLYLTSKNFSRLLFFYEIYKKIVNMHGIIIEFGTRWGQTVSILSSLRGIFEPFNRTRKIVGFDTFRGHTGMCEQDGSNHNCKDGAFAVTSNYENHLDKILTLQEQLNPISHIKKFELIKGDVVQTLPVYLEKHPETIVSLAVFDMDIYTPTKAALEIIQPYLCKGSILVFDDLVDNVFPGETAALREAIDMRKMRIQRMSMTSRLSYLEVE